MTSQPTTDVLYDPSTADFQDRMWDVYRVMRDDHPVYRDPRGGFFALTRFDDVWRAVHDWEGFSSVVEEQQNFLPQMIYMDPPRHSELRSLVSRAFTPKRVAEVEQLVRQVARDLLDGFEAQGSCDLQHEYAAVVPSVVIAQMIGVDAEHVAAFRSWTESFLAITGPDDYAEATRNIYGLFSELLAARRRASRDDLMSALIAAEVDGQRLADEELLGFCLLLILAGNDTTSSLIGSGTVLLAERPEVRDLLRDEPDRWPQAVEEMNRLESPTQVLPRTTTRAAEFHGVTIPEGSRVMLVWGAANHDEREFADPDRFDVTRTIARHLAFGHGVHYCLGANLARLEARVALQEWTDRFPDYSLAGAPQRAVSIWARAFSSVPVQVR